MSASSQVSDINSNQAQIGNFERNLTWWVLGCIVVGIALGKVFPGFFQTVGSLKAVSYTHLSVKVHLAALSGVTTLYSHPQQHR